MLRVPKVAREKTSRLYEIYCKLLLPFDTLSSADRQVLEKEVLERHRKDTAADVSDPCVGKGRSKTLSEFFCLARNTTSMYFDVDPGAADVEAEYWKLVNERKNHVAVQVAHVVDEALYSSNSSKKYSSIQKGRRSMASLQQNASSVLRHLKQQISGVTVPMLHINMLFSTNCWSRNIHFLPIINYIHTGADTIWYCVPGSEEVMFKNTLTKLAPELINAESQLWLADDSIMVSPAELQQEGSIRMCRVVQQQGQFIVVFPQCFTATVGCGYSIAEHISYASPDWIPLGFEASKILENSNHPELFSTDELLVTVATSDKTPSSTLQIILPLFESLVSSELAARQQLVELGIQKTKNWNSILSRDNHGQLVANSSERRCHLSEKICYLSAVTNDHDGTVYSAEKAVVRLRRRKNVAAYRLRCRFDDKELEDMLQQLKNRAFDPTLS
jgi:protein Jumonji